jgi:hypothetical protein
MRKSTITSSVIRALKSDLFNLIKEKVCSYLYVDAKTDNVFFPRPLKLLYIGSYNKPKE